MTRSEETYRQHMFADGTTIVCHKQAKGSLWLVSYYAEDGVHIESVTYIHEWEALKDYAEIVRAAFDNKTGDQTP